MPSKKATIKTIRIAMGDTEVELTPEEARGLRDALNEIYAAPAERVTLPIPTPYPVPVWPRWPQERWWGTWCGTASATSGTLQLRNTA